LSDVDAMVNQDEYPLVTADNDEENLEDENPLHNERVNGDEMCITPNFRYCSRRK